jgi:hypothetical protein
VEAHQAASSALAHANAQVQSYQNTIQCSIIKKEENLMARDKYHQPIKESLELAGWLVYENQRLRFGAHNLNIDLIAHLITADRGMEKIAVEVKDFSSFMPMGRVYEAIGQCLVYKGILQRADPERQLYMGISQAAARILFREMNIQIIVDDYGLRFLIVNIKERRIVEWL